MATIFIRKESTGLADGTSEDNAYAQSQLSTLLANSGGAASAGDRIALIHEDGVEYDFSTITITNANGTAGNPIWIIGVDGSGLYDGAGAGNSRYKKPVINSGRSNPWTPGSTSGGEPIWLGTGTGYIYFSNIEFKNCNSAVSLKEDVNNFYFHKCDFVNCGAGFYSDSDAGCTNLEFDQCRFIQCAKEAIRLRDTTNAVKITKCYINSEFIEGGNITQSLNIGGSVNDVEIRGCWIGNSVNHLDSSGNPQSSYIQGDGIVSETGTSDIRIYDTTFYNNTDGGVDMKGTAHILDGCRFAGGTRNIRFWASNVVVRNVIGLDSEELESTDTGCAIQFNGAGSTVYNTTISAGKRGPEKLIQLTTGGAEVEFVRCKFIYDTNITTFAEGNSGDEYTLTNCTKNGTFVASDNVTF